MTRRISLMLSVGLVLWAAIVVPMPFFEVQPGEAHAIDELVAVSATTGDIRGDIELLTIRQITPNIIEALWIGVHPDRDLQPAAQRTPGGMDPDAYHDLQSEAFRTAFLTAMAVAATEAGHEVQLQTRAVVAQVLQGGPSDGLLRPGDELVAIDGTEVDSGPDLVAELTASDQVRTVQLEAVRDGDRRPVAVPLQVLAETGRPGLGIVVETVASEPQLPFDATMEESDIGGPSAGLMIALTATDLLLEEDLTRGRRIAGTGTIDRDGRVGPVGGVRQKAAAAIDAEVDLLLVPLDQLAEASAAADAGIDVVGVATFQDALDAVRGTREGVAAG